MKFSPKKAMEELEKKSFNVERIDGRKFKVVPLDDVREVLEP
jgi:hypothetical protein